MLKKNVQENCSCQRWKQTFHDLKKKNKKHRQLQPGYKWLNLAWLAALVMKKKNKVDGN